MPNKDDDDRYDDQASRPDPFQKRDDGFFSPKFNEPRLPQDYDTPAGPPSDVKEDLPKDFPETDEIEESEVYDEGVSNATDADAQKETRHTGDTIRPLEPEDDEETGSPKP